jgi:hypothetical protein
VVDFEPRQGAVVDGEAEPALFTYSKRAAHPKPNDVAVRHDELLKKENRKVHEKREHKKSKVVK